MEPPEAVSANRASASAVPVEGPPTETARLGSIPTANLSPEAVPADGGAEGTTDDRWRFASGLQWVRDADGTLLVCPENGALRVLSGIEEIIWDAAVLGQHMDRVVRLASGVSGCSVHEARLVVASVVASWVTQGILVPKARTRG